LKAVSGRNWEITFFDAGFVTQVRFFVSTSVPTTFYRIYMVVTGVGGLVVADIIKNEEFSFRTKESCVNKSCG
jgi:hypothetical protein